MELFTCLSSPLDYKNKLLSFKFDIIKEFKNLNSRNITPINQILNIFTCKKNRKCANY